MAPRRFTVLLFALFALIALFAGAANAAPTGDARIVKRSSCAECVEGERCVGAVDGMVSCIYEADKGLERRVPV
ncbi:hypothetical protein DFJ74DRAFT_710982 [Hyaloraphidium curvatum]|nr:hypothetical protein DFJ74DRAFT_710982 [Hyaloraphidium curvatum]